MSPSMAELLADGPSRPLRREEYDHLVAAGAFEGEPIELIEGKLVVRTPQGTPHAYAIQKLNRALMLAVGSRAEVRVQLPLAVSDLWEPEPDFAVIPAGTDVMADHRAWRRREERR